MHSMEYEDEYEVPNQAAGLSCMQEPGVQETPTKESVAGEVAMLVEMGFEADAAENALLRSHGNVDLALAYMLEHPDPAPVEPPAYRPNLSEPEQPPADNAGDAGLSGSPVLEVN